MQGLTRIEIRQQFSKHTLAFVDYKFQNKKQYSLPKEDTPVHIRWGMSPTGVRSFYGYVNHYETGKDNQERALTRIVTLGTSKKMNGVKPDSWQGTTRSNIAKHIAAKHKLRSLTHLHNVVVDHWATGPRTDFQALNSLGDESGYKVWVDGSTVYFIDPTKTLQSASSNTVSYIRNQDMVIHEILGGSNVPGDGRAARRQLQYGLDYRTNEFFQSTSGDPTLPAEVVTDSVNTFADAEAITNAAARKQSDYYVLKATMKIGNAKIHPGSLVNIEPGRVNRDQSGTWLITAATHVITRDDFTTYIVATRGKDGKPLSRIPTPLLGTTEGRPAVVRDGTNWEAELQEHVRV